MRKLTDKQMYIKDLDISWSNMDFNILMGLPSYQCILVIETRIEFYPYKIFVFITLKRNYIDHQSNLVC